MRRLLWIAVLTGCAYPEFGFAGAETSVVDAATDSVVVADGGEETTVDDSATPDTTPLADAAVEETAVADSTAPDTAKPDTTVPDTAPPSGCAGSTARFCADWDKSTAPQTGFDWVGVGATAKLALDGAGGRSLPNAMLAETSPSTTTSVVVANVGKTFTTAANDTLIRVDVYLKLESATYPTTTGGVAFLFKVQRDSPSDGDGVTFSIDKDGYLVDRIGLTYEAYPLTTKPKAGVWTHVRMHTKLHTTAGSLTVWIDDMTTPAFSKAGISTVRVDSTEKHLIVGHYAEALSGTFRTRYDDVTLNY